MALASLKNVAKSSGVSIATVSQVLNGSGRKTNIRVSEATRKKVMAIARKLNYQPNALARGLRTQSSNTIGLLIPSDIWFEVLQARVAATARLAHEKDLDLMTYYHWRDEQSIQKGVLSLRGAQVAALIVPNMEEKNIPASMRDWVQEDRPILYLSYYGQEFNTIDTDRSEGFRLATEYLVRLGHRKLGIVLPDYNDPKMEANNRFRLEGFRRGLSEAGLSFRPECVIEYSMPIEEGMARAMQQLVNSPDRPTALLTFSDTTAVPCIRELMRLGLNVPKDISVIGFDNSSFASQNLIPITTLAQPVEEMAKHTIDKLIEMIREKGPRRFPTILCPPELIIRETTAPPSKS